MSLTADQKNAVRCSLGQFTADAKGSMVVFYQTLLGDNPKYHDLFPGARGVKVCDFASNAYIRDSQGPKTGNAVVDLVGKVDDAAALKAAVHALVHAPQHTAIKLTKADYANAFTALVNSMKKVLGDKMTPAHVEAWTKLAEALLGLIEAELK